MASALADVEALLPGLGAKKDEKPKGEGITKTDFSRASEYLQGMSNLDENGPIKQAIRCFMKWGIKPLILIIMAYVFVGKQLYKVYKMLPMNLVQIIFGAGLCFFGGCYFAAIAAAEAAINFGGEDLWIHLNTVWEEGNVIANASAEDDKVDANKDSIADVDQMTFNDLITHKAKVAAMAVKDPMRLQKALVSLSNMWLAVIATLKFKFAQTVAIALGIANMVALPLTKVCGPMLCFLLGNDLKHWAQTIIDTTTKVIAVVLASYLQALISAFYSGLRGGKMIAVGVVNMFDHWGVWDKLPDKCVDKPFNPDNSYIDEVIGYPIAALGFYWQVTSGFTLIFPFNLICLPLTIIEWILRFQTFT